MNISVSDYEGNLKSQEKFIPTGSFRIENEDNFINKRIKQ
jgi:hypothetical protein